MLVIDLDRLNIVPVNGYAFLRGQYLLQVSIKAEQASRYHAGSGLDAGTSFQPSGQGSDLDALSRCHSFCAGLKL